MEILIKNPGSEEVIFDLQFYQSMELKIIKKKKERKENKKEKGFSATSDGKTAIK